VQTNRFKYPAPGLGSKLYGRLANSALFSSIRRKIFSLLPFPTLESDVVDVVYLNWVVPADLAKQVIPPGIRLKEKNNSVVLTALTYRHGHFGPSFLGPLRRLTPSPLQSNWRFYVSECPPGHDRNHTVLFLKNVFDSGIYSLGSRMFSDALPSHLAKKFVHEHRDGQYLTEIDGGIGSAPAIASACKESDSRELPREFSGLYNSWSEAVTDLVLQDFAISWVDDIGKCALAEIALPIDVSTVTPLVTEHFAPGEYLKLVGATSTPFSFCVPAVNFKVLSEKLV